MRLHPEERRPCGERGLIALGPIRFGMGLPDVADCLVARPKPWLLTIWEPLITKAPSPAIVSPYCCYTNTVIFYARPYQVRRWKQRYWAGGTLLACWGSFEKFDQIETRLTWEMPVGFEGETFTIGGGQVVWASHGSEHRQVYSDESRIKLLAEQYLSRAPARSAA